MFSLTKEASHSFIYCQWDPVSGMRQGPELEPLRSDKESSTCWAQSIKKQGLQPRG